MKLKSIAFAIAGCVVAAVSSAAPVTLTDPNFYTDLSTGTSHSLAGFDVVDTPGGAATLHLRFGQWNGKSSNLSIVLDFGGSSLAPFTSTSAYYESVDTIDIDVSSLLTTGMNTLSVFATLVSGGPVTYSLGELSLTYDSAPTITVPEPASLALVGLAAIAGLASRRRGTVQAA